MASSLKHKSKHARKTLRKRFSLWEEQNGHCVYCGKKMWVRWFHTPGKKTREATIEHIIPKDHGGTGHRHNLACSCMQCNHYRGTIEHDVFKHLRKQPNWQQLIKQEHSRLDKTRKLRIGNPNIINERSKRSRSLHREMANRVRLVHATIYI